MKRNIKTYNRYFSFILYEEDETQMKGMEYITKNYKYARILHDRDKTENGEKKKNHYHVIIYIGKNPRNRKSIAKETGIEENYIEGCNKDNMLLYLIHYNNPEKTQYDVEEIDGEMQKDLINIIKSKNEYQKDKLEEILSYIINNKTTITDVTKYCIKSNYYEILKQNQYLITKIIQERNCKNATRLWKRRKRVIKNKNWDINKDFRIVE